MVELRLSKPKLPLERLSATSLSTAIVCPEQFRQRYILGYKEKMFGDRFIGIVDHRTHEENFRFVIENGAHLTDAEMKAAFRRNWDDTIENEGEPDWRDDDPQELAKRAEKMVLAYHRQVSPRISPLAVEQRFEEPFGRYTLVGYLDLVAKDSIVERKTTKQKVSKPKPKWSFQGRIYTMVAKMGVEWHVVTKQATPAIYTPEEAPDLYMPYRNPDPTVRLIEQTILRIEDLYARYGENSTWPTEGIFGDWLCDYCAFGPRYMNVCAAWREDE